LNLFGALNGARRIFLPWYRRGKSRWIGLGKKQGAAGITTAAPYIAGQWGRGDNRLPE